MSYVCIIKATVRDSNLLNISTSLQAKHDSQNLSQYITSSQNLSLHVT